MRQIDFTHTFSSTLLWESSFAFASVGGANGQDANLSSAKRHVAGNLTGFPVGGGWGPGEYQRPDVQLAFRVELGPRQTHCEVWL